MKTGHSTFVFWTDKCAGYTCYVSDI